MISPETAPPGIKVTVPLADVITGAREAREVVGHAARVTRVEGL